MTSAGAGVITASNRPGYPGSLGLSARSFGKPVTVLRGEGADAVRGERLCGLRDTLQASGARSGCGPSRSDMSSTKR